MKKFLATLAAGAMLAVMASAPASAAGFKIKTGTSAKDAGRCAAATVLFAKLAEALPKEEQTSDFADLAIVWINYITSADTAFGEAAAAEMGATATRYDQVSEGGKNSDAIIKAVAEDIGGCMAFLTA
jgi:hypothetical protein